MKIENLCINCMREMETAGGTCEFCGFHTDEYKVPRHHMRPFTVLAGKYVIGKAIGEGGFGITYIGMDLNLEARVAIKEYYPRNLAVRDSYTTNNSIVWSYSEDTQAFFEEGREKFINEARAVARFRELSEVVNVMDFFKENQTAYIVMEYLDGQTLKQYINANSGKLPADKTIEMMQPLIGTLGKLHKENLIHRDISPDNIMILKDGSEKLLDFGGARDYTSSKGKSMSVMIKHGYAPEEQYMSRGDQGPWTDVYALCATMYYCITGTVPPDALERLGEDRLRRIAEYGVECPQYIENAILKGLNIRKVGRYQTMEELSDALYTKKKNSNKSKLIPILFGTVVVAVAGIIVAGGIGRNNKPVKQETLAKTEVTRTVTPEPTALPAHTASPIEEQDILTNKKDKVYLSVEDGIGGAYYEEGEKVKIKLKKEYTENVPPYFPIWSLRYGCYIKDPYSSETEIIIMPNCGNYITVGRESFRDAIPIEPLQILDEAGKFPIKINGESYTLPMTSQEVKNKGLKCESYESNVSEAGYYTMGAICDENFKSVGVAIKLDSEDKEPSIIGMRFYLEGDITDKHIELPGGINENSTKEDIEKVYGMSETNDSPYSSSDWRLQYYMKKGNLEFMFNDEGALKFIGINMISEN